MSVTRKQAEKARFTAAAAIRRGDLVRQPCELCGNTPTHAHHDDYTQPLAVRWLCPRHHSRHHAQHPVTYRHERRRPYPMNGPQSQVLSEVSLCRYERLAAAKEQRDARADLIASIQGAHAVGCSFAAIAKAMGVTRQMAWKLAQDDA